MDKRSLSALDDPVRGRHAWARFRRLMRWMALASAVATAAALAFVGSGGGTLTPTVVIATVLGVGLTMLVGTALMLLVFLSNGTGHDEEVQRRLDDSGW